MNFKENTKKKRYSFKKGEKFCQRKKENEYFYEGATFRHKHLRRSTIGSID